MVRVVTLPPHVTGAAALAFAESARRGGAGALEVRTDLHAEGEDLSPLAGRLPLLAAARRWPAPAAWRAAARWCDVPFVRGATELSLEPSRTVLSHHAAEPLSPDDAEALWRAAPLSACAAVKHVEPLGPPAGAARLFETQRRLERLVGQRRVTVLGDGALALPFRAALADKNAFDYLTLGPTWAAAEGQRLLVDAVRAGGACAPGARLGIIGVGIENSRSPRTHCQPFDRIELPPDVDLKALLDALCPLYKGLAVTSPFKHLAAAYAGAALPAVNTLVRRAGRYYGLNTDVDGARAVLRALGGRYVTLLGDGGAAAAVKLAARELHVQLEVVRHTDARRVITGPAVWTWPTTLEPPRGLDVKNATIALIAYGTRVTPLASALSERGARVRRLGPRWFAEQARAQARHWEAA
ncbi:MAG: shikimate dehydrogenase [Archangiaceae bacterium]|nr:shikimate dehydrogenase [Archangiaceae bacterium]